MVAEGADRPEPLAGVALRRPLERAVERGGIAARPAVGSDQACLGQRFAALRRDQHLAFGHDRGGEIEHHRGPSRHRQAGRERGRRKAPLDRPEGRHEEAPRDIDEVDRHDAGLRRLLGPFPDPSQMARVAQRHHGHAVLCRLGDAELHRDGAGRLSEPVMGVEERESAGVADHLWGEAGHEGAVAEPGQVARNPDDAVAIVTREVRGHEVAPDPAGFGFRASRVGKDVPDQHFKARRGDQHGGPSGNDVDREGNSAAAGALFEGADPNWGKDMVLVDPSDVVTAEVLFLVPSTEDVGRPVRIAVDGRRRGSVAARKPILARCKGWIGPGINLRRPQWRGSHGQGQSTDGCPSACAA